MILIGIIILALLYGSFLKGERRDLYFAQFRKVSSSDIDYLLPRDRHFNENGVRKISDIISSELIKDTKIKNYISKKN